MSLEIRMPQIASDMTEADVVSWLVSPGDRVEQGEIVLEIETEKSTVEVEAPASGILREILVPAGTTEVAVGTLLARLEADESAVTDAATAQEPPTAPPPPEAPEAPPKPPHPPTPASRDAETPADAARDAAAPAPDDSTAVSATALARRVADQAGVDLADVAGTGPRGRITRSDVEQRIAGGPATAAAPGRAASPAPHAARAGAVVELTARCRVDALVAVRDRLNGSGLDVDVSLADLVVRALALALRDIPEANAARDGRAVAPRATVDVAIGVSAEREIVAPVLRSADEMGLAALSADRRRLVERARAGELSDDERDAACIAVLDVGIEGIDGVLPALVPPRAGILGIGAARAEPVVEDGRIVPGTTLVLSLRTAADVIDETTGARLLGAVRRRVERPLEMIA